MPPVGADAALAGRPPRRCRGGDNAAAIGSEVATVGDGTDAGAHDARGEPVPGTVRLMTSEPVEMPLSAAGGQSSLAEQLEERPWLVAVGILAILGFLLLVLRRRDQA
jgi:LPXTG-motif cell wall-anchored protein